MRVTALLFLFLGANPPAPAQQRTRSDQALKVLTLVKITVAGLSRYKEVDVVAASGLHAGTQVTSDDLQAASDRLGATGAFASIEYRFIGVPTGVSVVFRVKENAQTLPTVFDNFVWFSREELVRQVHATVPLFNGSLPVAGEMQEQVRQALERVLAARGIPGQVIAQPEAELGGAVRGIIYRVEGAEVTIGRVQLEGVVQLDPAPLQEIAKRLTGQAYLYTFLRDFPANNFRPLYFKQGYLDVAFDDLRTTVSAREGSRTSVAVAFPVREGRQFRFAGIAWTGNTVFSADELSQKIELLSGQPADAIKLEYDLGKVRGLYGSRGYMGVRLVPKPVLSATGDARFEVTVAEGEVFHMGSLEVLAPDLDLTTRERLRSAWKIQASAVYDSNYKKQYMVDSRPLLPRGSTWEFTFREEMDDQNKLVNLTILMKPAGQPN
ncbi:MAG: POTRA domain-containing protein [Terriglobales bacterium]